MNPDPATNPTPETPTPNIVRECAKSICKSFQIILKENGIQWDPAHSLDTIEEWIEKCIIFETTDLERALADAKREYQVERQSHLDLKVKLIDLLHAYGTGETEFKDGENITEMVTRIVAERDAATAENERLKADKEETRAFLEAAIKEQVEQAEHWKEHYKTDPQGRVDNAFWDGKEDAFKACLNLVQSTTTQEGQG